MGNQCRWGCCESRCGGRGDERFIDVGVARKTRKRNIDTAPCRDIKYAFLNSRQGAMADVNQTLINSRRAHTHNAIAILLVVGMRRGGKKETRRIADYSCSFIDSCLPSSRITLRRAWISFARSPCHFWEKEKNNTSQTCFFFPSSSSWSSSLF